MKIFDLRFFDGEAANPDGGTPEPPQQGGSAVGPDSADSGANGGCEEDYSAFDVKSPLLMPGREEDEADGAAAAESADGGTESGGRQSSPQEAPQQPYRTLKYHGQEVPVNSEAELIELASKGLDYTQKTQFIAPYRGLIEKLNADPALMAQVVGLVNGGGVPAPQNARGTSGAEEPTPRDDETWDDYIARRDKWREERGNGGGDAAQSQTAAQDFQGKFNAAMSEYNRQNVAVRTAQLTMQDPRHMDVLNAIASELPQSIQAAMNSDPAAYQMVYDQLRRNITGEPFFAALGRNRTARQSVPPQGGEQTVLKAGSKPAPVVESGRGQRGPGAVQRGPQSDIWNMDDAAFARLMEKSMNQR